MDPSLDICNVYQNHYLSNTAGCHVSGYFGVYPTKAQSGARVAVKHGPHDVFLIYIRHSYLANSQH